MANVIFTARPYMPGQVIGDLLGRRGGGTSAKRDRRRPRMLSGAVFAFARTQVG